MLTLRWRHISICWVLLGPKLSSNRQVFGLFLHHHITEKLTIRNAATEVIEEVKKFWERARIPVRDSQHCISKLEKLFNEWKDLKKHKNGKHHSTSSSRQSLLKTWKTACTYVRVCVHIAHTHLCTHYTHIFFSNQSFSS